MVPVPDIKNGWTDFAQIWHTDRDQLLGCRESQLEARPRNSARTGLNFSLGRLSPPKVVLLVLRLVIMNGRKFHTFLAIYSRRQATFHDIYQMSCSDTTLVIV